MNELYELMANADSEEDWERVSMHLIHGVFDSDNYISTQLRTDDLKLEIPEDAMDTIIDPGKFIIETKDIELSKLGSEHHAHVVASYNDELDRDDFKVRDKGEKVPVRVFIDLRVSIHQGVVTGNAEIIIQNIEN